MSAARTTSTAPTLSVVVGTDTYQTVVALIARLAEQGVADQLELVLVSTSGRPLELDSLSLAPFNSVQVIEPQHFLSLAEARRLGVQAATAPLVQIGETHAFPRGEWAEALIRAHERPVDAVVGGILNANPDGAISWANLIADYGGWLAVLEPGPTAAIPPYNTSFTRTLAHALARDSPTAFAAGHDITTQLHRHGARCWLESSAQIEHVNVSQRRHWLRQRYVASRSRTALRVNGWPPWRRAAYVLAAPLIPVVLLARAAGPVRAAHRRWELPRLTIPALIVSAIATTIGEVAAFAFGRSTAIEREADDYELHKVLFIRRPTR